MREDGFIPNPYEPCVLNKQGPDGAQVTVLMHVYDLLITSKSNDNHTRFKKCMHDKYKEIKISTVKVMD
jgi:hypothetical protein